MTTKTLNVLRFGERRVETWKIFFLNGSRAKHRTIFAKLASNIETDRLIFPFPVKSGAC